MLVRAALLVIVVVGGGIARHHRSEAESPIGPTNQFDAKFPLGNRSVIHAGTDLYYFHDAVGQVTRTDVVGSRLEVQFTINPDFLPKFLAMPSTLSSYRSHENPAEGWITIVPESTEGKPMSPRRAARIWGTGA